MQPLNIGLNVAVQHMAERVWPKGFDISANAPETLGGLRFDFERFGRIRVSSENSGRTIFADPEINYSFRAWHDWTHLQFGLEFNLDGEVKAALIQCNQLVRLWGDTPETREWCAILLCEIIGQTLHYFRSHRFPDDQYAFTVDNLDLWRKVANHSIMVAVYRAPYEAAAAFKAPHMMRLVA